MNTNYDIKSILNAIDEINTSKKNRPVFLIPNKVKEIKKTIPTIEKILPLTEKLILEAENYSKIKAKPLNLKTSTEDVLILNEEYNEYSTQTINLEKIKHIVINDLYSQLSKKFKKNTLKTVFDLREKINDLEEKIKILNAHNTNKNTDQNIDNNNPTENNEHLINPEILVHGKENYLNVKENDLTDDIIKTLKQQNSTIKDLEDNEEKLRLKIIDLEQDITLLRSK